MSQHVLCGFPNVNVTIKRKKNHNHNNACEQSAFMSSHHLFFLFPECSRVLLGYEIMDQGPGTSLTQTASCKSCQCVPGKKI